MRLTCPSCQRGLEFTSERPLFCAWCGRPLPVESTIDQPTPAKLPITGSTGSLAPGLSSTTGLPSTVLPDEAPAQAETAGGTALTIGEYRIHRKIGSGGMGTVYEGAEMSSGRPVAVKIMKPGLASTPGAIERFRQEGRLASLIAHPRCVFVFKADEEAGSPYIVMERVPGATLKDLVTQQGPLPPPVAVAKMIDILDGLVEAHTIGVIHRDVKPSNCFLMPDGRVKIGDFGLSKFVPQDWDEEQRARLNELTRSGVFLGTPLYASPEQIRGEAVDFRTDVYSAAATLFFLLTGKAPHETTDPTQTVARIVSEPPPSPRRLRPEVPHALADVVLRGLERQRERRWQSLEEFREALLPFVMGQLKPALRLPRLRAFLLDGLVLLPFFLLIAQVVERLMPFSKYGWTSELTRDGPIALLVLFYFGLCEGLTGQTVGKWLLRLKVRSMRWGHAPGKRQTLVRVLLFFTVTLLAGRAVYYLSPFPWLGYLVNLAGLLVIVDTMRLGNNYRGLHDLASRTVVVQLPWPRRRHVPPAVDPPLRPRASFIPERIGTFRVHGTVRIKLAETILAGYDPVLERQGWLPVPPAGLPGPPAPRPHPRRPTRLRWLASGELSLPPEHWAEAARAWAIGSSSGRVDTLRWDAFLAGEGCPLPQALGPEGLNWAVARPLLEDLADELAAGLADGTLPDELAPDYLWVQPNGRILLIGSTLEGGVEAPIRRQRRALAFLGRVARLLLEGQDRQPEQPEPIRAPIPAHAREIVDRLVGMGTPYGSIDEFQRRLRETADLPTGMSVALRLSLLGLSGLVLAPVLIAMFVVGRYYHEIEPTIRLTTQIRRAERVLRWLDEPGMAASLRTMLQPKERLGVLRQRGPLDFLVVGPPLWLTPVQQDELVANLLRLRLSEQLEEDRRSLQGLRRLLSLAFLPDVVGTFIATARAPLRAQLDDPTERLRDLRAALAHVQGEERVQPTEDSYLGLMLRVDPLFIAWASIFTWLLVWTVVSAATRGGVSAWLFGLELVRRNGQPAARWQAALRTLLAWLPIVTLLAAAVLLQHDHPTWQVWPWVLWWLAVLLLGAYVIAALLWPTRLLHDRLLGVQLMPR
ncbi:MAG TPA: protein kinase [Gemmatales bacterium]|nr:protein kinase [Gemmatales bacterium]